MQKQGFRRVTLSGVLIVAMAFGAAGVAQASAIKHQGPISGVDNSSVDFTVAVKGGEATKVKEVSVTGMSAECSDGSSGSLPKTDLGNARVRGNKFKVSETNKEGGASATLKLTGKLKKGGKQASGTVRLTADFGANGTCDSGKLRYKTG